MPAFEIQKDGLEWSVVYDRAIRDDGSLFFPERQSKAVLDQLRKTQGPYIFANQYLNRIIPLENQTFKKEWFRNYQHLPTPRYTFAFFDPAISDQSTADFSALAVVHVDCEQNWYLEVARKGRITVTQQIDLLFQVHDKFKCNAIGVEDVAYQRALIQLLDDEMRKRGKIIPVTGIKRGPDISKEARIRSLVPRLEWGRLLLNQGLDDFIMEALKFPRGTYDDLLDAVQSIEDIVFYPQRPKQLVTEPHPLSPEYERRYIEKISEEAFDDSDVFDI